MVAKVEFLVITICLVAVFISTYVADFIFFANW